LKLIFSNFGFIFGIAESTLTEYKKKFPEFSDTIKEWKGSADEKVERSLYERATGYSHPDTHISNYQGTVTQTEITKTYPPDPTSIIFISFINEFLIC
jgi:hypothetical protein